MITLAYGVPGAGKTTLLATLIRKDPRYRYFVVDHTADWLPESDLWQGSPPPGLVVFDEEVPAELPESGVFVFHGWRSEDVARLAIHFGPSVFVDDEIDMVSTKGWPTSPVRELIHRGRHVPNASQEFCEVHIFGAARRPANLVPDLTQLMHDVYVFKCQGDLTRQRLERDGIIETQEDWARIQEQEPGQFLYWCNGNRSWLELER